MGKHSLEELIWVLTKDLKPNEPFTLTIVGKKAGKPATADKGGA